jgi:hypothetical protein
MHMHTHSSFSLVPHAAVPGVVSAHCGVSTHCFGFGLPPGNAGGVVLSVGDATSGLGGSVSVTIGDGRPWQWAHAASHANAM